MTTPTIDSAAKLANDLLTSWVSVKGAPQIPAGRRDEVVAVLTACMVRDDILGVYIKTLKAGWAAHRAYPPMAGYPSGDIPAELIVQQGFTELGNAALADIALDPAAVLAVHKTLNLPPPTIEDFIEPGEWFLSEFRLAHTAEGARSPTPAEWQQSDTGPTLTPRRRAQAEAPRTSKNRWLAVAPWAVAAVALVGAFVVWEVNRKTGPGGTEREVLVARATPTRVEPRGANGSVIFDLDLRAERAGFATVVVFPVDKDPRIYPETGQDETRVGPDTPASVGPFQTPVGSTALIIVTETPSADIVRRVVYGLPPGKQTPEAVTAAVRERLFSSGYRWSAFGSATATLPKP